LIHSGATLVLRLSLRFAALLLLSLLAHGRSNAAEEQQRPVTFAATGGVRLFNEDLDLKDDASFGARLGIQVSERWGVILDFVASHPIRRSTGQEAPIDALRALARANLLTGKVRPYAIAGIGGILFFFNDAGDSAEGAMTFGGGVDVRVTRRMFAYLEGSTDIYRADGVVYTPTGVVYQTQPRKTETLGTISIGIGLEF
jgi:opacity protein-like surface antigen